MAYERMSSYDSFPNIELTDTSVPELLRKQRSNGSVTFEALPIGANSNEAFDIFLRYVLQ